MRTRSGNSRPGLGEFLLALDHGKAYFRRGAISSNHTVSALLHPHHRTAGTTASLTGADLLHRQGAGRWKNFMKTVGTIPGPLSGKASQAAALRRHQARLRSGGSSASTPPRHACDRPLPQQDRRSRIA